MIGPYALGIIQDVEGVRHLAELGVVFLLFNIGLELSLERLRSMQKFVFGMGTMQVPLPVQPAPAGSAGVAAGLLARVDLPRRWSPHWQRSRTSQWQPPVSGALRPWCWAGASPSPRQPSPCRSCRTATRRVHNTGGRHSQSCFCRSVPFADEPGPRTLRGPAVTDCASAAGPGGGGAAHAHSAAGPR